MTTIPGRTFIWCHPFIRDSRVGQSPSHCICDIIVVIALLRLSPLACCYLQHRSVTYGRIDVRIISALYDEDKYVLHFLIILKSVPFEGYLGGECLSGKFSNLSLLLVAILFG